MILLIQNRWYAEIYECAEAESINPRFRNCKFVHSAVSGQGVPKHRKKFFAEAHIDDTRGIDMWKRLTIIQRVIIVILALFIIAVCIEFPVIFEFVIFVVILGVPGIFVALKKRKQGDSSCRVSTLARIGIGFHYALDAMLPGLLYSVVVVLALLLSPHKADGGTEACCFYVPFATTISSCIIGFVLGIIIGRPKKTVTI